jgi:hypothetical protein
MTRAILAREWYAARHTSAPVARACVNGNLFNNCYFKTIKLSTAGSRQPTWRPSRGTIRPSPATLHISEDGMH